jgi:transposase
MGAPSRLPSDERPMTHLTERRTPLWQRSTSSSQQDSRAYSPCILAGGKSCSCGCREFPLLFRSFAAVYENKEYSQCTVAALFGVSPATVRNLLRRKRESGSADALPHSGGKAASLDEPARTFVHARVKQTNNVTLEELVQGVARKHKKTVSLSTMCRLLQALGLPRKKRRSTPRNGTLPESSTPAGSTRKRSARSR